MVSVSCLSWWFWHSKSTGSTGVLHPLSQLNTKSDRSDMRKIISYLKIHIHLAWICKLNKTIGRSALFLDEYCNIHYPSATCKIIKN